MAGRKVQYIIDVDEKGAVRGAQKTEKALENVDKQAQRTGKSGTQMASQMQNAGKGVADLDRNSRGANQVLFSMSDAIQDASFAGGNLADISRYAGNNIAVAAEQFSVMSARAGGSRAALQSLVASFTGVGGIIMALNLGLVALNLWGDGLSDTEEKTEDLNEDIDTLLTNWEKTIEMQQQFGAFSEDETGLEKIDAQLREAREDLQAMNEELAAAEEAQEALSYFEETRMQPGQVYTMELAEQRSELEKQVNQYRDIDDLKADIKNTEEDIDELIKQKIDTTNALVDTDTQQAKTAKEIREEKERQLSLERMIADARRSTMPEQPEDQIMGLNINIPDAPDLDLGKKLFPEGSLGYLREQLRILREDLMTATDPSQINRLNEAIRTTQNEMQDLQGGTKAAGEEHNTQMGMAIANQVLMADTAEEAGARVIDTILAMIVAYAVESAMKSLPFPANLIAAAGAAAAAKGLQSLIPEFALGGVAMGPSHAQGGMLGVIGGKPAFEFEGGEAIINRKSTRMFLPQLNAINQAGGGVPLAKDGALTINAMSRGNAADLPMIGSGSSLEGVLSKLTQVLEDGITARTDLTELDDAQSRMNQKAKALGNV